MTAPGGDGVLVELGVEDLAVIERATVELGPGLTCLTGESGAGKSVLLRALDIACGGRADPDLVRRGAARARVRAVFEGVEPVTATRLADHGVPSADRVVVLREVGAGGRSLLRVNGVQVPLALLRAVAEAEIEVVQQGAPSRWLLPRAQLEAVDVAAGEAARPLAVRVAGLHRAWVRAARAAGAAEEHRCGRARELERARQDLAELEAARLTAGEDRALRRERELLRRAGQLRQVVALLHAVVAGGGIEADRGAGAGSARDQLAAAARAARSVRGVDPDLDRCADRVDGLAEELSQLGSDLRRQLERLEDDPARLAAVEERLALLERLGRRHGGGLEEALARRAEAAETVAALEGGADEAARRRVELERARAALGEAAVALHTLRGAAAERLATAVSGDLRLLLMPAARVTISLTLRPDPEGVVGPAGARVACSALGVDSAVFALATAPGELPRPLGEVASGGELARLVLVLQAHLAAAGGTPTVVFDEVDEGLGGEAASRVGEQLRRVAGHRQVLCVTHQASIAARADRHLVVDKQLQDDRHTSHVREVLGPERVTELARLLAGTVAPAAGRAHAAELLQRLAPAAGAGGTP